jgi:hypothetical protein
VAYEANVLTNYSFNSFDENSVLVKKGAIPTSATSKWNNSTGLCWSCQRTMASIAQLRMQLVSTMNRMKDGGIAYTANGHVPYAYPDTEEGRTLATKQIRYNPFPITEGGLAKGQRALQYLLWHLPR